MPLCANDGTFILIRSFACVDRHIFVEIQGIYFTYGNNVTNSTTTPTYLRTSAQRIFIDTAHPLPFGQLTNFYVFTSPVAGQATAAERRIQLQIWRLLSDESYQLVWQRLALVNTSSSSGALLTVSTGICSDAGV